MSDAGEPLPPWMREAILARIPDRDLAEKALGYIKVVERDGNRWVVEDLPEGSDHALVLAVHTCLCYAHRLLKGDRIDDP